ncbi:MAG: S8 family serine peptidase [Muricoprocola sp.]
MDQKLENLLNLSLAATPAERDKSDSLEVGFSRQSRTWDLIVKYNGNLKQIREEIPDIRAVELSGGFAIITVRQDLIDILSDYPEIEYIEKPKRLFFSVAQGKRASCIDQVQLELPGGQGLFLTGKGILVAVIDSGVDYTHPEFRNADGTTRIRAIWDQTLSQEASDSEKQMEGSVPLGKEFLQEEINQALLSGQRLPTIDLSGHGTQVLGIAAGNFGVAPDAEILVVKLGTPEPEGFPRTTELMMAIEYVYQKARELGLPVAINLSFGNVYGPHEPYN